MKKQDLKFCIVLVFALTLFISPYAKADWDPCDGHKMHFPQLPDEDGWNVNATQPLVLADDWRCSETGWVKDIHFWGSWEHGVEGQILYFALSIHDNLPADPLIPYSRPGETLWERFIYDFDAVPIDPITEQGWYDPNSGYFNHPDHSNYFQYNIFLNDEDWYWQDEGEIYWLNISAILEDPINTQWGWKSTEDHFMDDAVWALWGELDWKDMFEPNEPNKDDFWIVLDPAGNFGGGGGSGYVDPGVPTAPWYYYENTGWWNQWYYDGIFDPNRDKIVHIEFFAWQPWPDQPSLIQVALNWSTPEWPPEPQPEPVPPLPPLSEPNEDRYIRRETLLIETWPPGWPGNFYTLDYVIRDYNPEWVSIDVNGFNFSIESGIIWHSCVQSLDLAFVITGDKLDFGDLPDPTYPTLLASDGARHVIGGPWFDDGTGTDGPDPEPDGQPIPPAFGDDLDADGDDEDGLTIPTLMPGVPVTFPLIVSDPAGAGGFVEIWIDYNIDGDLDDAGELAHSAFLGVGLNNITITAPTTAVPGMTYARGRISSAGTGSPRGQADDGEVEDTEVYIEQPELDFGDLPDPNYPTLLASDGARHIITFGGPWMGDAADGPDPEPDGQPTPAATGDDMDGNDDEDGLVLPTLIVGQSVTFPLQINNVGLFATVEIWIDYNIDGDLDDAGELAYSNIFIASGNYLITINVPATATPGMTFARGRISNGAGTGSPRGLASDGEVEDTEVYIELPPEKPEAKHLKWSQPPIEVDPLLEDPEYCGWNVESWTQEPCEPLLWHAVADDFHCIGSMPVESIHFWGSYIEWDGQNPPLISPTEWEFTFYANTPAPDDPEVDPNYSHPSELLWKVIVPDERVITTWEGYDYYPMMPFETCFQYYVDLEPEEYFLQDEYLEDTNDDIYWLGIRAIYPNDIDIAYPWGWKTRPESWTDDAVIYECHAVSPDLVICRFWPIEDPLFGVSFDVAFELDTDPNYIKWEQPYTGIRDWPHYEDRLSMAYIEQWTEQIIKWSQKPDLEETGLDVDATIEQVWKPQVLADDFYCDYPGLITEIDVWGSWYHDHPPFMDPLAVTFTLSIHADAVSPGGYFMPGALLWKKDFIPGEFDAWVYASTDEGWFVPCAEPPAYDYVADHNCYMYSFFINPSEAFEQEPGNYYWLDVQAQPMFEAGYPEPIRFGWKNSLYDFEADGVWAVGSDPPLGQWNELIYPAVHPRAGESINLAFALWTDFTNKWVQEPELQPLVSIDVDATKEEVWKPQVLADDFQCTDPEPLTDIHIWASWYHDFLPYGDANNVTFTLSIHEDLPIGDPENPYLYSLPGDLLWTKTFEPGDFYSSIYALGLYEGWFVPCSDPEYYEPYADSVCYQYDFYIDREEAFPQEGSLENPIIYWLDVQAQPNTSLAGVPPEPIRSRFGWKTSFEPWNDDGVWAVGEDPPDEPWNELRYPIGHPFESESINLAFEITGEIEHEELVIGQLVADDWLCERRTPVTAIVWNGSYLGYRYDTPCAGIVQAPPIPPDYFVISIYEDVAADDPCNTYTFSHPGRKLWEYAAYDYDEVLVGYDKHPEDAPPGLPREPVYRYSVRLPEDKWFRQREINDVYWISIVAVYPSNAELNHQGWGWTIHEYVFGDNAVQGFWLPAFPPEWEWTEIFDQDENSADLSFILFTDPNECVDCADYNWDDIVNFYDQAIFALDWMWTGPAGGYANGDLNCNGNVDFEDLEIFCLQWLDSCP